MFVLLSPAKKLQTARSGQTLPHFTKESLIIAEKLQSYSSSQLHQLLHTSQSITEQNIKRYKAFNKTNLEQHGTAALFTYAGDVYRYFEPSQFDEDTLHYIQSHFAIITGLYGILKPLDKMLPYRLEMKNKLYIDETLLTHYWHQKLSKHIKTLLPNDSSPVILLCSNEYSAAINTKELNTISVEFKEKRDGALKTIAVNAKRARGMMAAFIAKNRAENIEDLKHFNASGYTFEPSQSSNQRLLFVRSA